MSAAAPWQGSGTPSSSCLHPPQPSHRGQGVKLWTERTEERDPGVAGGARTGHCWRSGAKSAGEKGKKHEVGTGTNSFPIRKCTSFLPNYSPEFLLPHSEQDCFICQWVLAMGSLNCPAPRWYRRIQPSINTNGSARAGKGQRRAPPAPSTHGTSPLITHPAALSPQHSKTQGAAPGWDAQLHPGGFRQATPETWGPRVPPPSRQRSAGKGGGEGQHWGGGGKCSTRPFGCLAGSSHAPCLTCNLHPEPNSRCSWEKPHPLTAGWVFLFI